MKNVVLRPLALFCITFFVSLCVFTELPAAVKIVVGAVGALAFAAFLICTVRTWENRKKHRTMLALCFFALSFCLSSALSLYSIDVRFARAQRFSGETAELCGTVTDIQWDGGYRGYYIVKADTIGGEKAGFNVRVETDGGIKSGEHIRIECEFSALSSDGSFDEKRYYLTKNVLLCAEGTESAEVSENESVSLPVRVAAAAGSLNEGLTGMLKSALGSENGGFAAAVLLGNRSSLSATVSRDFSRLGISHLLALSGLHLSVICAAIGALFSKIGRRWRDGASIIIVIFYMLVTGFSPSVTRAGLMLIMAILLSAFGHRGDGITNLGAAALIICIVDPFSAYDIGLQLSVAATLAVMIYSERTMLAANAMTEAAVEKRKKKTGAPATAARKILGMAGLTFVVVLFILPLSCLYFGKVSLLSPLTSVVYSLLVTVLLWLLPLVLLFFPAPTFCAAVSFVCGKLIVFITYTAAKISRLPYICVSLKYFFAPVFCVLLFAASVGIAASVKKKTRLRFIAAALSAIAVFGAMAGAYTAYSATGVRVTPVEVPSGDAALLTSGTKAMIIDVSDGYSVTAAAAAKAAAEQCCTEIDTLMITHLHNRFVTSLPEFFNENTVRRVLIPKDDNFREAASAVNSVAERCKVEVQYYTPGDLVEFAGAEVQTYEYGYLERSSKPLIRFDISSGNGTFVYAGAAYAELYTDFEPCCDVLWLGAHGPKYKTEIETDFSEVSTLLATDKAADFLPESTEAHSPFPVVLKK